MFFSFVALAVFDTLVIVAVVLLKGWPNVAVFPNLVYIFPITHPLLSCAYMMSIYLTVLMTLERFHAIHVKRMAKIEGSQKKIKWTIGFTFALIVLFNVPKFMEYTWSLNDIRTNYDFDEKEWTSLVAKTESYYRNKFSLDKGHFEFFQNFRDYAELGADDDGESK